MEPIDHKVQDFALDMLSHWTPGWRASPPTRPTNHPTHVAVLFVHKEFPDCKVLLAFDPSLEVLFFGDLHIDPSKNPRLAVISASVLDMSEEDNLTQMAGLSKAIENHVLVPMLNLKRSH